MPPVPQEARPTAAAAPAEQKDWAHSSWRHEFKYLGARWEADLARARLRSLCRPDPQYPHNRVHSLYFDSWRLRHLASKHNGDWDKTKLRLRWYTDLGAPDRLPGPAWLERKHREGALGRKERLSVTLDLAGVARPPAERLAGWIRDLPGGTLQPVCWISYRRHRYLTSLSGQRVALDHDLRVHWVAPWILRPVRPFPHYVLEVKSPADELDRTLHALVHAMVYRSGFSKYAWVLEGDIAA